MANRRYGDDPLSVSPNEEGIKRRQAEFLMLNYLRDQEVAPKDDLKQEMKRRAKNIAQSREKEPPIYFSKTSGSARHQAREFNEVLDRCLRRGWVERTIDGKYGITDDGLTRVEEIDSGNRYDIDQDIKSAI